MSFSITVTVDTQELERIAAQLDGKTDTVVKNIAYEATGKAKTYSPIDTGYLRSSIIDEPMGNAWHRINVDAYYGIYQELGFHHWKSGKFIQNPFLIPAVEEVSGKFFSPSTWSILFT
jgi:hypothetical protein